MIAAGRTRWYAAAIAAAVMTMPAGALAQREGARRPTSGEGRGQGKRRPADSPKPAADAPVPAGGEEGRAKPAGGKSASGGKEKLFDFEGLNLEGTTRMPQLLYFLDRASQELQRASL